MASLAPLHMPNAAYKVLLELLQKHHVSKAATQMCTVVTRGKLESTMDFNWRITAEFCLLHWSDWYTLCLTERLLVKQSSRISIQYW